MALSPLVQRLLRESDGSAGAAPMGETQSAQPEWYSTLVKSLGSQSIPVTPGAAPSAGSGGYAAPATQANGNVQQYVQQAAAQRGWTGSQWNALADLIRRESSWNPTISNPSSGAYGLFQFMPMHWKPGGYLPNGRGSSLEQQVAAGLRYIADRYGTPQAALDFWQSRKPINGRDVGHWY